MRKIMQSSLINIIISANEDIIRKNKLSHSIGFNV